MPTLTATLEHDGVTYQAEPAKIERTMLGSEDHGIFTFVLHCSGPSWGQGAGTYSLDTSDPLAQTHSSARVGTAAGFSMIMATMAVIGVDEWESIQGKRVLVLREGAHNYGPIAGLADLDAQRVIIFKTFWDEFHARPTHRRYVDGRDEEPTS